MTFQNNCVLRKQSASLCSPWENMVTIYPLTTTGLALYDIGHAAGRHDVRCGGGKGMNHAAMARTMVEDGGLVS